MNIWLMVVLIILAFVLFRDNHARNLFFNIVPTVKNGIKDGFNYIRYKKYNECKFYGKVICLVSAGYEIFGCGKTLSAVKLIVDAYNRYEGKTVWNYTEKKWDIQHIKILSNVEFKQIPYEPLKDCEQIVKFHEGLAPCDVGIVLLDEGGSEMNARNFKTNISSKMLKKLVTCRHLKFGMVLTSQTFDMLDNLLRRITDTVYFCTKKWRSCILYGANARDVERVDNFSMLETSKTTYFATDELYAQYDTYQNVEDLRRDWLEGKLLTDDEERDAIGEVSKDLINVKLNKKYYRRHKKYGC